MPNSNKKKLYIKTYGCQMNVYDSDRMADLMKYSGYELIDQIDGANMVIINTCHIREKASEKLFCDLGRINKHKRISESDMIVAVAGCVAQAEGEEIFKRAPVVDIIVGPESYHNLPDMVAKINRGQGIQKKQRQINLDFSPVEKFDNLPVNSNNSISSFVTIQEGCDKFCTFCVVPYTRGPEFSRPVIDILSEVNKLVEKGVIEIYLLGQNVNAYHGLNNDKEVFNLAKLIKEIAKIPQVKRIRYTTSHPKDMDSELITLHGDEPKLMPFLHLPVQSGSNNILKAMNRKHTRDHYFKIIDDFKKSCPNISLSSDFIVGFPGESDKDFADTIDLIKKVGYSQCYSFKYSPRPGTVGETLENQVDEKIKDQRLQELQTILYAQQLEFNQQFEGKTIEVLFDKKQNKNSQQLIGKSEHLQSVVVDFNPDIIGKITQVKIQKARPSSLMGQLIDIK